MADGQPNNQASSAFPNPPPFYRFFTTQNLDRLKESRESQENGKQNKSELARELQFLLPPRPPTEGGYRCFGGSYDIDEKPISLTDQGIEQLFPAGAATSNSTPSQWTLDRAFELKKIAKSLLLNFLELVGTLSVNPEQYGRKVEDIRTLFINAHHLLNEYRPHQARETLILMMEQQLERSKAEIESIKAMKMKVNQTLIRLGTEVDGFESCEQSSGDVRPDSKEGSSAAEGADIWNSLRAQVGM